MKKFIKIFNSDAVFVLLSVLLCLQIDWEWTNIKSFLTGGVIFASATLRILRRLRR